MALTGFPNGVSSFGVPVFPGGVVIPPTTGSYFFVHSGTGTASFDGLSPQSPKATIAQAIALCTASKGDVIVVMPGHAENISSATSLVVNKAGVSIIGLGVGRNRPVLTFSNTAGSIEMDAANTRLSNMVLLAGVSAVVVGLNVDADDVILDNLTFDWEDTGDDFITMVDIDAFDRISVINCVFIAEETAGAAEAIRLDDCHNVSIIGCQFTGIWSDSPIVGEGALGKSLLIRNNVIYNGDTSTTNGIVLAVAFTGVIADNRVGSLYATAVITLIDPGSCLCFNNLCANAIDESGILIPATLSGAGE